jgi:hypothetical protein
MEKKGNIIWYISSNPVFLRMFDSSKKKILQLMF